MVLVTMPLNGSRCAARSKTPEFVSMSDTMPARAKRQREGEAVVQHMRTDLAGYCSLNMCTNDDVSSVERLGTLQHARVTAAVDRNGGNMLPLFSPTSGLI